MKKIISSTVVAVSFTAFFSCEEKPIFEEKPFVVSFEEKSVIFSNIKNEIEVKLLFSKPAKHSGSVVIKKQENDFVYNNDYKTIPTFQADELELPIKEGQTELKFTYQLLNKPTNSNQQVNFSIHKINYQGKNNIQGYTQCVFSTSSIGGIISPNVGGANQPNQVYIGLSNQSKMEIIRDAWDLRFYCGDEFYVGLNGSIYMAAKKIETSNFESVTENILNQVENGVKYEELVTIGQSSEYIDNAQGDITQMAIKPISPNEADNNVYLINIGYKVGNQKPKEGSVAISSNHRGWKKVKITRQGDKYQLRYADLNGGNDHTVLIDKDSKYNFIGFSFDTNQTLQIQPEKENWDLCFSVFSNIIGAGSYGFSDFVINNVLDGTLAYELNDVDYKTISKQDVDESKFSTDQRAIGSNWRAVFDGGKVYNNVYILKTKQGNYYKIKFLSMVSQTGERGYPKFEYELLK